MSEELVALAFFDESVSIEKKQKMVLSRNASGHKNPPKRARHESSVIQSKELENFVSVNTNHFFEITGLSSEFLKSDPAEWAECESFMNAKAAVAQLSVVNDVAERGVALMEQYNKLHTNDEEQKQYLMLIVKEYRKKYPNRNKSILMQ